PRGAAQLLGGIGERAVWLVGGFQGLGRRLGHGLVRAAALGGPLCQLLPGGGQHQTAALLPGVSLQGEPGAAGELRWRVLSPAEGPGRWTLGGWHPGPPAAWHLRGGLLQRRGSGLRLVRGRPDRRDQRPARRGLRRVPGALPSRPAG
ncbi:unnamed protein product, partial [Polarella glacialis]